MEDDCETESMNELFNDCDVEEKTTYSWHPVAKPKEDLLILKLKENTNE